MKKQKMKKMLTVALTTTLAATITVAAVCAPVAAAEGTRATTLSKISNPEKGSREIDGLVKNGDRETSYAWCMAARGDYVYIGTNKNMGGTVVNNFIKPLSELGIPEDTVWALADVVSNGEVPRPTSKEGGQILKCNCKTNEIEVIYTAPLGTSFRMAITNGDNVYFGSYSVLNVSGNVAEKGQSTDIFRIDTKDQVEKVFSSTDGTSLRAACEMDGKLFFGGVDSSETLDPGYENCTKLAILVKDENDDTKWGRVADYRDFGVIYAADPMMENPVTSPIWDICSYNGEIYATLPNLCGFVVFKGHPARNGESANAYGWVWTEVVGLNNGINPVGLNPDASAADNNIISIAATPVVFNDQLYLFDFDNTVSAESTAFIGLLKHLSGAAIIPSQYLGPVYNTLRHPQNLWKLDNATGKFEKVEGFSKLMQNTTNEYVWRAEVYNDELYLTTMDSAIIYDYLTKLTNGCFLNKTPQELTEQLGYISTLIQMITPDMSEKTQQAKQQLLDAEEKLMQLISEYQNNEDIQAFIEEYSEQIAQVADAAATIRQEIKLDQMASQLAQKAAESADIAVLQVAELENKLRELLSSADISKLIAPDLDVPVSTLSEEDYNERVKKLKEAVGEQVEKLKIELPEIDLDVEQINTVYAGFADSISEEAVSAAFMNGYEQIKDSVPDDLKQQIKALAQIDPQAAADLIKSNYDELTKDTTDNIKNKISELAEFDAEELRTQLKSVVQEATFNYKIKLLSMIGEATSSIPEEVASAIFEYYSELSEEQQEAISDAISSALSTVATFEPDYINNLIDQTVDEIDSLDPDAINALIDQYSEHYSSVAANNVADAIAALQAQDIPVPDELAQQILAAVNDSLDEFRSKVSDALAELGVDEDTTLGEALNTAINGNMKELEDSLNQLYRYIKNVYENIDWDGLGMYIYISDMVKSNTWGFDMYKTADGVNFEMVTDDGFGDRYNYGGRSLAATPYGLYIGTANPFYGAQLFRLSASAENSETTEKSNDTSKPDDTSRNDETIKPDGINKPENGSPNNSDPVNTSDSTPVLGVIITAILSAGIAVFSSIKRKNDND